MACFTLGLSLIIDSDIDHVLVINLIGGLFFLFGVMHIVGYILHDTLRPHNRFDFSYGCFNIIMGTLLVAISESFADHFETVVAILMLFKAVTWLQTAIETREETDSKFLIEIVYAIILAAFAMGFFFFDFSSGHLSIIYHGITLMIEGGIEIFAEIHRFYKELAEGTYEERFEEQK